jgi:hypothetical protein
MKEKGISQTRRLEGMRGLGKFRRRWEDTIKIGLKVNRM